MTDWIEKHHAEQRTRKKGGPGSGHWGHVGRPGKRGGSLPGKGDGGASSTGQSISGHLRRIAYSYTDWETRKALRTEIEQEWGDVPGERRRIALSAIRDGIPYADSLKMRVISLRDEEELIGIATINLKPAHALYPDDPRSGMGRLEALATKREGYGRAIMQEVLKTAKYEGLTGLAVVSTPQSEEFYQRLGMTALVHDGTATGWFYTRASKD